MRALVIGCATACLLSALPVIASEKGQLLIWVSNDKGFNGLQQVADAFTRKTGIVAKVEHPDDATNRFQTEAAAGKGPDVFLWAHDRIGEWISKGLITEINPPQALRDSNVRIGWDAFTVGGKTWGYPIGAEAIMLIYNKKLLPTPPASFEEIEAIDKKLAASGVKAIGWDCASPYFTWPLLAANGGYVFKREANGSYNPTDTGINNSGALAGAEMLSSMLANGVLPKGGMAYGDAEKAMTSGKQAMWINGPWAWDSLKKANIDFGVAPLPTLKGQPARPFVGVLGAMLSAKSQNHDAAVDFIENYLMTIDGLKTMNADKPIGVPLNKRLFWKLMSDEKIRISMDGVTFGRPMPSNPEMGRFWSGFGEALKQIVSGQKKPREALDTAAKLITGQVAEEKKASAK